MQLAPYIFFYGRCKEALDFYKNAIGGDYHLQTIGESPMADQFPKETHGNVMHASFSGNGVTFMAADGRENKTIDPEAGNISLSISTDDSAEGERVFKALSEGGKVDMPLADAFWGGKFGMLTDKFGNEWMVSAP